MIDLWTESLQNLINDGKYLATSSNTQQQVEKVTKSIFTRHPATVCRSLRSLYYLRPLSLAFLSTHLFPTPIIPHLPILLPLWPCTALQYKSRKWLENLQLKLNHNTWKLSIIFLQSFVGSCIYFRSIEIETTDLKLMMP